MYRAAKVDQLLVHLADAHSRSDIASVDRNGGGMASRVAISSVQRRNERRCKGQVRALKPAVEIEQILSKLPLLAIQKEETLGSQRRDKEEWQRPFRKHQIGGGQQCDDRDVHRQGCNNERASDPNYISLRSVTPQSVSDGGKFLVYKFGDH